MKLILTADVPNLGAPLKYPYSHSFFTDSVMRRWLRREA
jgi:formylmethanofuran dehydrogenase subunit A